jgi:hypothetical protein
MVIIGVDYHPSFQTIAFCVEQTGESGERELSHREFERVILVEVRSKRCVGRTETDRKDYRRAVVIHTILAGLVTNQSGIYSGWR